jgi:hypothetical protein
MSAYATLILNFLLSEHGLALIAWIGSALAAWIGKQIVGKYKADAIQTRGWFFEDAIKEFGPDGIRMMLERAITVSKPGSALPVAPVAVQALFPEVKP